VDSKLIWRKPVSTHASSICCAAGFGEFGEFGELLAFSAAFIASDFFVSCA